MPCSLSNNNFGFCASNPFLQDYVKIFNLDCCLHVSLNLHFTPGQQSEICNLQSAILSLQSSFYFVFTLITENYCPNKMQAADKLVKCRLQTRGRLQTTGQSFLTDSCDHFSLWKPTVNRQSAALSRLT